MFTLLLLQTHVSYVKQEYFIVYGDYGDGIKTRLKKKRTTTTTTKNIDRIFLKMDKCRYFQQIWATQSSVVESWIAE